MPKNVVSFDSVNMDDEGAPLSIIQYKIYRNGTLIASPGTSGDYDDLNPPVGPNSYEVAAVASGTLAEGAKSAAVAVTVPSGIPAAPANPGVVYVA